MVKTTVPRSGLRSCDLMIRLSGVEADGVISRMTTSSGDHTKPGTRPDASRRSALSLT